MSQQTVSLDLPEELYERINRVAQDTNRPVERVLLESLDLLFGDSADATEALDSYSDEQLLAVVYRQFAWPYDTRMRELTAQSKEGRLTDDEGAELEKLVRLWDQYVLHRTQALVFLKQRGYDLDKLLQSDH